MYLFRKTDGSITPAPDDFDPQNPDWSHLHDVQEVMVVSKVLVPQIKLVPQNPGTKHENTRKSAPKTSKSTK